MMRHLYLTRNAVLGCQEIRGGAFEATRRMLTELMLDDPSPDPDNDGCYLIDVPFGNPETITLRVYTIKDGPLLVVPKV